MIIPIPSQEVRFQIKLSITVDTSLELGIRVYDPLHPHSYYFRRKAYFPRAGAKRGFTISLPVSPEQLELELFDKQTGEDDRFMITEFKIAPLPPVAHWASVSQHRFMAFAIDFAQKAGYAPVGFYESNDQEFLFQYRSKITDAFGNELKTPARTHRKMPRVQISQALFKTYTVPIRVAILAHEGCHWFLNTRSQTTADLCGIKQYLDYGFPTIEAVYAATKVFGEHNDRVHPAQIKRTKTIMNFIDHYKANAKTSK